MEVLLSVFPHLPPPVPGMLRTVPTGSGGEAGPRSTEARLPRGAPCPLCPGRPSVRGAPVTPLLWFGKTGRSAFQCLQKFQQHNQALKRKEWTAQEDRMLTQLVQEMRVGSHIPYRKSKAVPVPWAEAPPPCRCGSRMGVVPERLEEVGTSLAPSSVARRLLSGFTRPLCPQSSTTWKAETPCSSSTGGPRAWTPA